MLFSAVIRFTLLGNLMFPLGPTQLQAFTESPTTQPAAEQVGSPASAPAAAARSDENLMRRFENTRGGQIVSGKSKVSLNDLAQLSFWIDTIKELVLVAVGIVPRILVALLFLVISWIVYRAIRRVALGSMAKAHVDVSLRDMLGTLIKWTVMGFGTVIACNQIGIQITALLTGVSIIGLAVGFAAQETLANFIAGVVIFWDKPFKAGDWIDIGDQYGQVLRITFRSTRILSQLGDVIVLPNTQMLAQKVSNHSTHPITGLRVPIGIAYKESIDDARLTLLHTTIGDDRLCQEPPPSVVVASCADSSVNLELRMWIRDESMEKVIFHDYLEKAKKALDAANIQIPYPHVQLMLEDTPAVQMLAGKSPALRAAS